MQRIVRVVAALLLVGAANANADVDVDGVQKQLQSMLAGAQQHLQFVEEKNAELVKKVKDEAGKDLSDQAQSLGNAITEFAKTLTSSEAALKDAKKAAEDALDAANKNAAKSGSAESFTSLSSISGKANLMAKISVAERQLRRAQRRRQAAVTSAENDASGRLDDESVKFAMKLGDMTKWLDPAKEELNEVDEPANEDPDEVAAAAAEAAKHPPPPQDDPDAALMSVMEKDGFAAPVATTTAAPKPKPAAKPVEKKPAPAAKKKSFTELTADLDKASEQNTEAVKTATAKLRATFAKDEKLSGAKFDKLQKDLIEQRKKLGITH